MKKFQLLLIGAFCTLLPLTASADAILLNLPDFVHSAHQRYFDAYWGYGTPANVASSTHEMGLVYGWPFDPNNTTGGILYATANARGYSGANCTGSIVWDISTTSPQIAASNPTATSTYPSILGDFRDQHKSFSGVQSVCISLISGYGSGNQAYHLNAYDGVSESNALVYTDENGVDSSVFTNFATTSRIISVVPVNHSVVATSTSVTFAFTGYISQNDYQTNSTVHVHISNGAVKYAQTVGPMFSRFGSTFNSANTPDQFDFTFPLSASGFWSVSTTASMTIIGRYEMDTYLASNKGGIINGIINALAFMFGSSDPAITTLAATTTVFTMATTTAADDLADANISLAEIKAVTVCTTWTDWSADIASCVFQKFLYIDPTVFDSELTWFHDNILTKAPWGYLTRFYDIMALKTTPIEPPPLTYTFGSSSPAVLQGTTVTFQIWDNMGTIATIKADDGSNKNIWDIVDPYIRMIVAFGVLGTILFELLGIELAPREEEWRQQEVVTVTQGKGGQPKARRSMSWIRKIPR